MTHRWTQNHDGVLSSCWLFSLCSQCEKPVLVPWNSLRSRVNTCTNRSQWGLQESISINLNHNLMSFCDDYIWKNVNLLNRYLSLRFEAPTRNDWMPVLTKWKCFYAILSSQVRRWMWTAVVGFGCVGRAALYFEIKKKYFCVCLLN